MKEKVDEFLGKLYNWQPEMELLRSIALDCGLVEDFKWKNPCYTYKNANVLLIHVFKEYCGMAFFKGVLLQDSEGLLIQQTENVQAGRQLRFTNIQQIIDLKATIKAYIYEAIELEKAGIKVVLKKDSDYTFIEELQEKLANDSVFKAAFEALTPGRQRGYNLYFAGASQTKTQISRIEKSTERIMKGIGLTDCTCGLTKRKPNCDGSHKQLAAS